MTHDYNDSSAKKANRHNSLSQPVFLKEFPLFTTRRHVLFNTPSGGVQAIHLSFEAVTR